MIDTMSQRIAMTIILYKARSATTQITMMTLLGLKEVLANTWTRIRMKREIKISYIISIGIIVTGSTNSATHYSTKLISKGGDQQSCQIKHAVTSL